MKIGDEHYSAFTKARRQGHKRTEEVAQLVEAIGALRSGKAKSIILEPGRDPGKLRVKLHYAAKVAGRRINVATADDRVVFVLASRKGPDRLR